MQIYMAACTASFVVVSLIIHYIPTIPLDVPELKSAMGWKHRFYPVVYEVLRLVQQPRAVRYGEIVKLEQELRQAPLPEQLVMKPFSSPYDGLPEDDQIVGIQRYAAMLLRETGK